MENYNPITQEVLEKLNALVGEKYVWTDPDHLEQYKTDEETDPRLFRTPEAVVAPETTEQVAAIMKLANQYGFPVTPRSGAPVFPTEPLPCAAGWYCCWNGWTRLKKWTRTGCT